MPEPVFRYHPDPLATGSAVREDHVCSVCGVRREIRYQGPVYGRQPDTLCLHCIHSGEASRALGIVAVAGDGGDQDEMPAEFSDAVDVPGDVPLSVVEEVTRRTPGFTGWQQESWLYHCADAAAFVGSVGRAELDPHPEALDMLRQDCLALGWSPEQVERFLQQLDRTEEPTAYLFRCLHCGRHLASWDIS